MKKYILAYHTFILIKVSSQKLGLLEVYYIKKVISIVWIKNDVPITTI